MDGHPNDLVAAPTDARAMYAALVRGELSGTDALAASQQMLQILMDSMTNAVFWKDVNSAYLGCNKVFARFAGVEPAVLVGMSDKDMPWADNPDFPAGWFIDWDRTVIGQGEPRFGIIEQLRSASGEYRWIETNKVPLRDLNGEVIGVLGTFADITDRRRAEEELQETLDALDDRVRQRTQELLQVNQSLRREVEDRVRLQAEERQQRAYAEALRDTAAAMSKTFDVDEVAEEVVIGVQRLVSNDLTALVLSEPSGLGLTRLRVGFGYEARGDDVALDRLSIIAALRQETTPVVLDQPDEALGPAGSVLGVPVQVADQVIGYLFVESSTPGFFTSRHGERLRAVADQAGAAISNAQLASRVSEIAASEERQRVAQELHDAVNQSLWGAALTAESLLSELPAASPAFEKATKLAALTRGALAEMRSLLIELRPAELEAIPLHELIEHLLTALEARRNLDVEVQLEPVELDESGHLAFYRIAQEAIGNVAQHAQATSLHVHLSADPRPRLTVTDDGNGFDIGRVPAGHLGLRFMRERADAVGASFAIETESGIGTTVRVWYPQ
jgi:PAS domain S-box-containing protein